MKKLIASILYRIGGMLEENPFRHKTRAAFIRLSRKCWRLADWLAGYDYITDFA